MLKKMGRISILAIMMIVGTVAGTLISTICMSIIENAGKISMTEYFEISMSGSIGILFGTGTLLLYMKKKNTWNMILDKKEKLSVKKMCVYAVVVVCICKFVFEVVSTFVLSRLLPNMTGSLQGGTGGADEMMYSLETIILSVFGIVIAPIAEEILFRKCLYGAFKKEFGVTAAMMINVILFAALHGYGIQGFLSCALAGFVFAYLYERTGNIWYSIAAHMLCNAEACLSKYMKKIEMLGKPLCYEVNGYNTYHIVVFMIAVVVIVAYVGLKKHSKK